MALAGISEDELARYTHPADYKDQGGAVAQPGADAEGPHMTYPKGVYPLVIGTPDEVVWNASEKEPPVNLDTAAE